MSTYEWLGLICVLVCGFWRLHTDLQGFVRREDCDRETANHCAKMGQLETRLGKLENRVSEAETKIEIFHEKKGN